MTDSNEKEFETLDELYRRTFENLSPEPAASGWDTPSDRVWKHVRENITPPRGGWTASKFGLLAAFAVSLTVGLYFLITLSQPAETPQPAIQPLETPVETAETTTAAPMPAVDNKAATAPLTRPATPRPAIRPTPETRSTTGALPYNPPQTPATAARAEGAAQPLPGTQPVIPNTTERRRLESQWGKQAAWRAPLPTLPPAGTKTAPPPDPSVLRVQE